MIADDIHNIREGMRKIAQAKVQAEAEAARRAEADAKPADLPTPKPLFSESAPPFRGFFVTEDGDIKPFAIPDDLRWQLDPPPGGITTIRNRYGGVEITHDWNTDGTPVEYTAGQAAAVARKMAEDESQSVQAANRASNRFTFWGYRGEDPDGQ